MQIRRQNDNDVSHSVMLHNTLFPEDPITEKLLLNMKRLRSDFCHYGDSLGEVDGQVVASASYYQNSGSYHPNRFRLDIKVLKEYRNQGIGTAMYEHLLTMLAPFDPRQLRVYTRSNRKEALRFLEKRGYTVYSEIAFSTLYVPDCDLSQFDGLHEKVQKTGVVITTLSERLQNDPDIYRKIYDADWEISRDEPGTEDDTRTPFDEFIGWMQSDNLIPEAYFIAHHNDDVVGSSFAVATAEDTVLQTGFTGVKRAYRRKGIATAMKVAVTQYAKDNGFTHIRTSNEVSNRPMLAINELLGYERKPSQLSYELTLAPLEDAPTATEEHA